MKETTGEGAWSGTQASAGPPHPRLHEPALLRVCFLQHLLHLLDLPHVQAARAGGGREWGHQGAGRRPAGAERAPSGGYLDMVSGEQADVPPVEMLVSMLSELSRLRVS